MSAFLRRRLDAWLDIAKWTLIFTALYFASAPVTDALTGLFR